MKYKKRWVTRTHSWHNIHYQDIFHFSSLCNLEITPTFQNYTSYNKYIEVVYTFDIVYEVGRKYIYWSKLFYHFSFERGYLRRWKRIIVQIVSHATVIGFTSHKIRKVYDIIIGKGKSNFSEQKALHSLLNLIVPTWFDDPYNNANITTRYIVLRW